MSHRVESTFGEKLQAALPFGVGLTKPKHFRDMAGVIWKNRGDGGNRKLKQTGDAIRYGGRHLCSNGEFPTPDGKAHFCVVPLPPEAVQREKPNGATEHAAKDPTLRECIVSTRRGKQFNTLDKV